MANLKLPKNPTPEQFEKLKKPIVKRIIEGFYLDGVDELTVNIPGDNGTVASGKFLDKRVGAASRVFTYVIEAKDGEYILDYSPLSGDFAEEGPDDEDLIIQSVRTGRPVVLEFNEGVPTDEDYAETHGLALDRLLHNDLVELGLGDLVSFTEPEPEWARVEPRSEAP